MNDDLDLNYYTAALGRRWWLVGLIALVVALLVVALVPSEKVEHESNATVLVTAFSVDEVEGIGREEPVRVLTEVAIASSDDVLAAAAATAGVDRTAKQVHDRLTIQAEEGSEVMELFYRGATPDEAESMSSAIAAEYLAAKQSSAQADVDERLALTQGEIAVAEERLVGAGEDLAAAQPGSAQQALAQSKVARYSDQIGDLESRADRLRTVVPDVGEELGSASEAVDRRSGVDRLTALAAAVVLGLILGLAAALLVDRFDRRLRSVETIEEELETDVLGEIPRISAETPELVTAMRAQTDGADAFRRFGAAVLASGGDVTSVLVTSASDREGRTTTAVNTAIALQQAGRRVYLVSADRRNPEIDRIFGLTTKAGLDQYFRGQFSEADAQNLLADASPRLGMRVVASGTVQGSVPQPLSAEGVKALLAVAGKQDAVVVFDAPPATSHADGLGLAALCDRTFVVVDKGRSRRVTLQTLRAQLRNVHATVGGALTIQTGRWRARTQAVTPSEWAYDDAHTSAGPTDADWSAPSASGTS
ncbi:MAG: CpsD/CapB family tyrosine-protein kinase [Acidimicrobiia bacterium]|nr:CpsD/CapB family tyrosine-protein kinase [Acidimicrobiia bacterium]